MAIFSFGMGILTAQEKIHAIELNHKDERSQQSMILSIAKEATKYERYGSYKSAKETLERVKKMVA